MTTTFPTKNLSECVEGLTVGWVGPMASEYVEIGVPFLRSLNVNPYRVCEDDIRFIRPEFHTRIAKSKLNPGDLVVVRTGAPGTAAVIPDHIHEANCSDLVIIRTHSVADSRFLCYVINGISSNQISANLVGAVQQHFNVGSAKALEVPWPRDKEREAIASILGALDDKIDLNRRMNETLEAMARAIFKSWFVDFDPVRAKAEGKQPFGMDADTAALFPDRLVDSKIGPIPEGWEVTTIGEATEVLGGGTPRTKESAYWDGGVHPFVTPKDMSPLTSSVLLQTSRYLTDAGVQKVSSKQLPVDTVLMSSRAPIGYLALAKIPVSVNQGIIALRCNERATHHWAIEWCRSAMDEILSRAGGSTFAEISKKGFRPIPCVLPHQEVMSAYDETAKPIVDSVTANERESRTLAELRDLLLPKLLSGEIRVKDAEKAVEVAV